MLYLLSWLKKIFIFSVYEPELKYYEPNKTLTWISKNSFFTKIYKHLHPISKIVSDIFKNIFTLNWKNKVSLSLFVMAVLIMIIPALPSNNQYIYFIKLSGAITVFLLYLVLGCFYFDKIVRDNKPFTYLGYVYVATTVTLTIVATVMSSTPSVIGTLIFMAVVPVFYIMSVYLFNKVVQNSLIRFTHFIASTAISLLILGFMFGLIYLTNTDVFNFVDDKTDSWLAKKNSFIMILIISFKGMQPLLGNIESSLIKDNVYALKMYIPYYEHFIGILFLSCLIVFGYTILSKRRT
ncbi:hypothetical protein [Listeria booriae]|uniref:hypothetical protein n=1 Tax=Listeria booriae TaxID=1552123 RepID=UPI0018400BDA|nr:hypothetical protein [Listeria booriae]MBC2322266.1 hypothetical protein [Listeria booriae]